MGQFDPPEMLVYPQLVLDYCKERDYPPEWAVENGGRFEFLNVRVGTGGKKDPYVMWNACAGITYVSNRSRLLPDADQKAAWYAAAAAAKTPKDEPQRYTQPKGSKSFAYWGTTAAKGAAYAKRTSTVPLLLFEGESNWLTLAHKLPELILAPEPKIMAVAQPGACAYRCENLTDWPMRGRAVLVVPDRDDPYAPDGLSPGVRAGWRSAASYYARLGAVVSIALLQRTRLGRENVGGKLAIDSYLIDGGTIEELFAVAVPVDDWDPLLRLKRDYAIDLKTMEVVTRLDAGQIYTREKFDLLMANKPIVSADGKSISSSAAFWRDPERPEFTRRDWLPDEELGVIQVSVQGTPQVSVLNIWHGIEAAGWGGAAQDEGVRAWADFKAHVRAMSDGNPSAADLNLTYIAHMLRHPLDKPCWWWYIYDERQGIGKTGAGKIVANIIGGAHAFATEDSSLFKGDFTGKEIQNMLLLVLGDINTGSRQGFRSMMYGWITDDVLYVNDKRVSRYGVPSYHRGMISSNKPSIQLDREDRRLHVTGAVLPGSKTTKEYSEWFRGHLYPAVLGDRATLLGIYRGLMEEYGERADKFNCGEEPPKGPTYDLLCDDSSPLNLAIAGGYAASLEDYLAAGGVAVMSIGLVTTWLNHTEQRQDIKPIWAGLRKVLAKHSPKGMVAEKVLMSSGGKVERVCVVGKSIGLEVKEEGGRERLVCTNEPKDVRDWMVKTMTALIGKSG